ncbi:MAG: bifunctional phosphopantothenoylcysteine decarboxylase/phosphopantothenate--cysteine ligase CoaBC [Chitinispirillaceae bacterium]
MGSSRNVLLGITGGIAAYKIPQLIRIFRKRNCQVKTVLTPSARGMVGLEALKTVSGNPVFLDDSSFYDMDHIRLSEWADIYLISPATANTIAKITHGIADNLLTSLALSIPEEKIVVAPAMNSVMWANKATCANIEILKSRGVTVLPVGEGELACNVVGPGRMIEVEEIAGRVLSSQRASAIFEGKHILISSGPTEEAIDPVRVITNRSSGKMGAALAKAALAMGARVTVVTGPAQILLPSGARVIPVKSAAEMKLALEKEFDSADVCIMAAAVSDYRPKEINATKIHREDTGNLTVELVPNPDIVAGLGKHKKGQILVGFSLECGNDLQRAAQKMKRKNCDMMVFNRAEDALGMDSTAVTLLFSDDRVGKCPAMGKLEAAEVILKSIAEISGV